MTAIVKCPLCREYVRVKVTHRRVGTDQHGRPVLQFRASDVTHPCREETP